MSRNHDSRGFEPQGNGDALPVVEKWYERLDRLLAEIPLRTGNVVANPKHLTKQVETLRQRAEDAFEEMRGQRRAIDDDALTRRVLQSGTLTDRVAAMALAIGEFPVQSLTELEKLVTMSGSKGRREASLAMDALRDLLMDALLPPSRRLNLLQVSLETQAVPRPVITKEVLALLKFEDSLKELVATFMRNLDRACKDELSHHKITAMKRATDLLMERPEQERFLLSLLCSKMGDPDLKAATQASHLLRKVINRHSQMRLNIVAELEASILSSSATPTYVYEAVIFLNQTILLRGDVELANRLVDIYFALFERSLAVVEKADGANKFKAGKKKKVSSEVVEARKGLNSRLLAALLTGVNRALPFCDVDSESSKLKFTKRCDQLHRIVKDSENFSNVTQALALLFKLEVDRDRYHIAIAAKLLDPALVDGKKTAFLNLLYKSLKSDTNRSRVAQTIKTLLNVALQSSAAFAAASLFLLSNVIGAKRVLLVDLLGDDSDETADTFDEASSKLDGKAETKGKADKQLLVNVTGNEPAAKGKSSAKPLKNKTKTEFSLAWEIDAFKRHYHPTVQSFAKAILQRDFIEYSGDPLHDFSITAFLDRFVYRNPKEKKSSEEPDTSNVFGAKGREQRLGKKATSELPVNSEAFHHKMVGRRLRMGEETDRFFFKYFDLQKKQGVTLAQGPAAGRDVNLEDLEDEYADTLAENLLKKAAGGGDADVDDEIADEMSPVEDLDDEDEDEDIQEDIANPDFSDDENDEDDIDLDDEDEVEEDDIDEDSGGRSMFADADDFAGLLGGSDGEDDDKAKWLAKSNKHRGGLSPKPSRKQSDGKTKRPSAYSESNKGSKKQRSRR